ncbi:MAG: hypothetical protein ACOX0A_03880 [Thermoguttaceae bacterium]|jgi:hypothetical protein
MSVKIIKASCFQKTFVAVTICILATLVFARHANGNPDDSQPVGPKITIANYEDFEVVRFPVVLLRGEIPDVQEGTAVVENLSSSLPSRIMRSKIYRGRFKILAELTEGVNRLSISADAQRLDFTLIYRPNRNPRFLRLIYFFDSSGLHEVEVPPEWLDGRSDDEVPSTNFVGKLQTAARLWQTATAERLYDAGYGRRTFRLETDDAGQVVVWKQRGKRTKEEYCAKSELERFNEVYKEVVSGPAYSENACYFIVTAFGGGSKPGEDQGRIALGSDLAAMLDANTLFAWPDDLSDAIDWLSDPTPISDVWSRDSAYRNTRWALTASTLGAGLHELGHAFGLNHSTDPNDFMSRGFDRFNRIFTLVEPASAFSSGGDFSEEDVVEWTESTAPQLIRSEWIEE